MAAHGKSYASGMSRGDTPPAEIRRGCMPNKKPCPDPNAAITRWINWRDDDAEFAQRSSGMSLDIVQPDDVLRGHVANYKNYNNALRTDDLPRARPTLAHDTTGAGMPVPWRFLDPGKKEEIPGATAHTHYPYVNREQNFSLRTCDIHEARPRPIGLNCEGRPRKDHPVHPARPVYQMFESLAEPPLTLEWSGRNSIEVSDIEKTSSNPAFPIRNQYGDPLTCEPEFRSAGREDAINFASERHHRVQRELHDLSLGLTPRAPREPPFRSGWRLQERLAETGEFTIQQLQGLENPSKPPPRKAALTPRREGPQRGTRLTDALDPDYVVPVAGDTPGTSLHANFSEEKRTRGHFPPTQSGNINVVRGSRPKTLICDNGEPQLSLVSHDLPGAAPIRRIGNIPYSIYGPAGVRVQSISLDANDIEGAQADTLKRAPKLPLWMEERNKLRDARDAAEQQHPLQQPTPWHPTPRQPTPRQTTPRQTTPRQPNGRSHGGLGASNAEALPGTPLRLAGETYQEFLDATGEGPCGYDGSYANGFDDAETYGGLAQDDRAIGVRGTPPGVVTAGSTPPSSAGFPQFGSTLRQGAA